MLSNDEKSRLLTELYQSDDLRMVPNRIFIQRLVEEKQNFFKKSIVSLRKQGIKKWYNALDAFAPFVTEDKDICDLFISLLESEDSRIVRRAIEILTPCLEDEKVFEKISKIALEEKNHATRDAIEAIATLIPKNEKALSLIISCIEDDTKENRCYAAIKVAVTLINDNEEIFEKTKNLLFSEDYLVRSIANQALAPFITKDEEVLSYFISCIDNEKDHFFQDAIKILTPLMHVDKEIEQKLTNIFKKSDSHPILSTIGKELAYLFIEDEKIQKVFTRHILHSYYETRTTLLQYLLLEFGTINIEALAHKEIRSLVIACLKDKKGIVFDATLKILDYSVVEDKKIRRIILRRIKKDSGWNNEEVIRIFTPALSTDDMAYVIVKKALLNTFTEVATAKELILLLKEEKAQKLLIEFFEKTSDSKNCLLIIDAFEKEGLSHLLEKSIKTHFNPKIRKIAGGTSNN